MKWYSRGVLVASLLGSAAVGVVVTNLGVAQGGLTLRIACGTVGSQQALCKSAADKWAAKTGNKVDVVPNVASSNERLALFQQQLSAGSSDVDVYQIENIWPGLLADYFVDLKEYVPEATIKEFFPSMIEADTVDGKLVDLPWYGDAGLLYYRKDLLEKYGYKTPPSTWTQLTSMATKIQQGERKDNPNFWGYVWQGAAYEGLTCDALEWIYSYGGGTVVDNKGNVTVNNKNAAAALDMAAKWVGTISPKGVTTYKEEDSRGVWQAGNAAFMRNWPYAFPLGNGDTSPVKGKFDVTVLPKGPGATGKNAATFGGHSLSVNRFSKNAKAAADLVIYMTSAEVQKERAIVGGYNPSRPVVYKDADVLKASPFLGRLFKVFANAVVRPTTVTATKYPRVSEAFWNAANSVLTGQAKGAAALQSLEDELKRIKGAKW
jgi:trehalose/maltose transport system substrate-binding protein